MTPKPPPSIPICKVCQLPIMEAKPTRNKNLTCLRCMANGGVDLLDHCPLCQRRLRHCECDPPPQERS